MLDRMLYLFFLLLDRSGQAVEHHADQFEVSTVGGFRNAMHSVNSDILLC